MPRGLALPVWRGPPAPVTAPDPHKAPRAPLHSAHKQTKNDSFAFAGPGATIAFLIDPSNDKGLPMSLRRRTALNALRRAKGESELDAMQFLKLARARMKAARSQASAELS